MDLPVAIARAAMDSGVATRYIDDLDAYKMQLAERMGLRVAP